jgi:hypothetical protein
MEDNFINNINIIEKVLNRTNKKIDIDSEEE